MLGDPIDRLDQEVEADERWSIHRDPPDFDQLSPTTEIFETGLKVVDLIAPYVRGGKSASSAAPASARPCSSRS